MFGKFSFKNKVVVITGGSSGLGLGIAKKLAKEGAKLALIARNLNKLEAAKAEIIKECANAKVEVFAADVIDEMTVNATLSHIADQFDGIDCLINSAGILREAYFENFTTQDFREVMDINFFGIVNTTYAALPHLKASKGRLVNIASVAGLTGVFGFSPYVASKHALVGLTETLRTELKPVDVKVHLVCPPEFDSPMVDNIDTYRTKENEAHTHMIPKQSLDTIVNATIKGIQQDKFKIVTGVATKLVTELARLYPDTTRTVADTVINYVYEGPDEKKI